MSASVAVTIVTYNSRRYIAGCLDAVLAQDYPGLRVVVVDNQSADGTWEILGRYGSRIRRIRNSVNAGFAAAQNRAIAASRTNWVLALNPDVLLHRGFVSALVEAGERDPAVGTVCGKLLRIGEDFRPLRGTTLDSTGLYFTPNLRHFDRGSEELDRGQYDVPEYVFGACAAAALYRREMIDDISTNQEFFDPDFFSYREDADVAWRAQLLGWRCLYTPEAVGSHVRGMRPNARRSTLPVLNMHSVKNRFLMRTNNITGDLYRRHFLSITARDLVVLGGCLLVEPASLPAFWRFARCLPRALARRRQILTRRRISDGELASWFSFEPSSQPAPVLASQAESRWTPVREKAASLRPA
jgi:GT2 family glycosyltransferase